MRRKQRGFGPHRELEMMLVAALGIIAVVAFPAYQDYTIRERVAAGLAMAVPAQNVVAKNFARDPAAKEFAAGWKPPAPTEEVASIALDNSSGVIKIGYTEKAEKATITLTPVLAAGKPVVWRCAGEPRKYMPRDCRLAQ